MIESESGSVETPLADPSMTLIKTDVDALVKLVQEKNEIPLNDAAQMLKMPAPTLEKWANFLEEEGILSIRYKLTTPYLVAINETKTKKSSVKSADNAAGSKNYLYSGNPDQTAKPSAAQNPSDSHVTYRVVDTGTALRGGKSEALAGQAGQDVFDSASKDISSLFEKAYELMEKGNFEQVQKIYELIKERQEKFPHHVKSMKREIDAGLTKLDKDFALNVQSTGLKKAEAVSQEVLKHIGNMQAALGKNDLSDAERAYRQAQDAFVPFPEGFTPRRIGIQTQILNSYIVLSRKKKELLHNYTLHKLKELSETIASIRHSIDRNDIHAALSSYASAQRIYNQLPEGFIAEHIQIDRELFSLLPTLAAKKEELVRKLLTEKSTKIKELATSVKIMLQKGSFADAAKTYGQMKQIYAELPDELLEDKIGIAEVLLELNKEIITTENQSNLLNLQQKSDLIASLLKKAQQYLDKGHYDMADTVYNEMLHHYNQIPSGYLEQKTQMRVSMLDIYKQILEHLDEPHLKEFDERTDQLYRTLLSLLVEIHTHIERREFDVLESKYQSVKDIYGKLPVLLVQQKSRLWQDITKVQHEIVLYKKTLELEQSKDNPQLLVTKVAELRAMLSGKEAEFSEDQELLRYLLQQADRYAELANAVKGAQPAQVRPLPQPVKDNLQIPSITSLDLSVPDRGLAALERPPAPQVIAKSATSEIPARTALAPLSPPPPPPPIASPKPAAAPQNTLFNQPAPAIQMNGMAQGIPPPPPRSGQALPASDRPRVSATTPPAQFHAMAQPALIQKLTDTANKKLEAGNTGDAETLFQRVLRLDDHHKEAREKLASIGQQKSSFTAAAPEAQKVIP